MDHLSTTPTGAAFHRLLAVVDESWLFFVITNTQFWWHLARASGVVAWVLLGLSVMWGILLSSRVLRTIDRPAWLLDLHRWLGTLTWATVGVHLLCLIFDSYVQFSIGDLLVPWLSNWKPAPLAWGIFGLYLIVVVQVSSRFMKRLPHKVWHTVHLLSYPSFAVVSMHSFMAGTDSHRAWFTTCGALLITGLAVLTLVRIILIRQTRLTSQGRARAIS
ncbi:MAG: hypothetical protein EBT17_00160 [Actinobacteria bacterium]|nr:hypothetical protein [Actinomycetota bacterium]NBP17231.1 hypothetical protein [Actinomycetota bacterium]NBR75755.1 hypothetical protein [Actinomycetota bacterium]NBR91892.1 hypothetical protein [Actinomycetota bacterium]NBT20548.1 hypothetical protein [Actinomycetota bacterium]